MISILAGNPKVELVDGAVKIEPQLIAFAEAMKIVCQNRDRIGRICVEFDNPGIFKKQFVDGPVPKNKSHLDMGMLREDIRREYEIVAREAGIALENVGIISEDICRAHIKNLVPRSIDPRMYVSRGVLSVCSSNGGCDSVVIPDDEKSDKVNCRGIVAAAIHLLSRGADELRTFFVYAGRRVQPVILVQGTEFSYEMLGLKIPVEQTVYVPEGGFAIKTRFTPDASERNKVRSVTTKVHYNPHGEQNRA